MIERNAWWAGAWGCADCVIAFSFWSYFYVFPDLFSDRVSAARNHHAIAMPTATLLCCLMAWWWTRGWKVPLMIGASMVPFAWQSLTAIDSSTWIMDGASRPSGAWTALGIGACLTFFYAALRTPDRDRLSQGVLMFFMCWSGLGAFQIALFGPGPHGFLSLALVSMLLATLSVFLRMTLQKRRK